MRITNFSATTTNGRARVSATATWEDCDRSEREVYYETETDFADDLTPNPNAFLLAAFIPAMKHGEQRVQVEGSVCPQLRNGLVTAMDLLQTWYGEPRHRPVTIEPTEGFTAPRPRSIPRTAVFMSGGVDAFATLRGNRQDFQLEHAGSIRDGFFVHGFDVGGYESEDKNLENFALARSQLSQFAKETELTLIPVYTNIRYLDDSDYLFATEWFGAALAAVAHAFSRRITTCMIGASWHISDLMPWGSHPLLDPNYTSANVTICHDGVRLSRLDKVRLIAEWDTALRYLRACFNAFRPGETLNCGKCEKCLRTMTELLVIGKLERCDTFPAKDVTPGLIRSLIPSARQVRSLRDGCSLLGPGAVCYWREMIEPLKEQGRPDLAQAIESKLREVDAYRALEDWRDRIVRVDRKCLGGIGHESFRRVRRLLERW